MGFSKNTTDAVLHDSRRRSRTSVGCKKRSKEMTANTVRVTIRKAIEGILTGRHDKSY